MLRIAPAAAEYSFLGAALFCSSARMTNVEAAKSSLRQSIIGCHHLGNFNRPLSFARIFNSNISQYLCTSKKSYLMMIDIIT